MGITWTASAVHPKSNALGVLQKTFAPQYQKPSLETVVVLCSNLLVLTISFKVILTVINIINSIYLN